jgi:hypothetical protein
MSKYFFDQPQLPLLSDVELAKLPIIVKYENLFDYLDLSDIPDHNDGPGCSGYSRHSLIKAFIIKEMEQISSVPKLRWFLQNQPHLSKYIIGFRTDLPDDSTLYRFLQEFTYPQVQALIAKVNTNTLQAANVKIEQVLMDSKPVKANTRENNPKNFSHNLSDKDEKPARNEKATLGHLSSTNDRNTGKAKKLFFWGYRLHVIFGGTDDIQLPLITKLFTNRIMDEKAAPPLFRLFKKLYEPALAEQVDLSADKRYDDRNVYEAWHNMFHGRAFIPTNKRNRKEQTTAVPVCKAGLTMKSAGSWVEEDKHRKRFKFRCPDMAKDCPFRKSEYGCTQYRQISEAIPGKVYEHESRYKKRYPKRQGIERYNATLQRLEVEDPNHFLPSVIECATLFTVLGAALVAAHNVRQKLNPKTIKSSPPDKPADTPPKQTLVMAG